MIKGLCRGDLNPATSILLAALLLASACSKPRASAPTDDFARRHACPSRKVETTKEGSDRLRVTGCGESEAYVRECANRSSPTPRGVEPRTPLTKDEAFWSGADTSGPAETGCAWSREQESVGAGWKPGAD